jgi:hypothetical protein
MQVGDHKKSSPMTTPSKYALTPSEIVLIRGTSFAARKRPVKFTIVLLLATALNAYLVEALVCTIRDGWASQSWPVVQGTIVSSAVVQDEKLYKTDVQFEYEVGRRSYKADTVSFSLRGVSSADKSGAQAVVDRYPPGKAVQVAYDPSNRANGVLEPGILPVSYLMFLIVTVLTTTCVGLLVAQLPSLLRR